MTVRKLQRKTYNPHIRQFIYYVTEGEVTEVQYIRNLQRIYTEIRFKIIKCSSNNPKKLLESVEKCENSNEFRKNDYLLVIMDRDEWLPEAINKLWEWKKESNKRLFILSNPCFELWLLRHYTSGSGASTCKICREQLRKYNKNIINKKIPDNTFNRNDFLKACINSRNAGVQSWEEPGFTNCHELIELLEKLSPES